MSSGGLLLPPTDSAERGVEEVGGVSAEGSCEKSFEIRAPSPSATL